MLIWINSPKAPSREFLFLDRDGILNEDRPDFITCREDYRFYPDALEALRWLKNRSIQVILVSNQSGLNRAVITWENFWDTHHYMLQQVRAHGGDILAAFYCPHRPDEHCRCRKPSPEMILKASRIYRIPLRSTFMIGDRSTDMQAAANAGCRAVFLDRSSVVPLEGDSVPGIGNGLMRYSTLREAVIRMWGWKKA